MRVCIVAEGCYPYVVGGVSSWIHSLIKLFPKTEFVILAIVANRSQRGKFVYELPENVSEVHELYLEDVDWNKKRRRRKRMSKEQYKALRSLILNQNVEWNTLFDMFQSGNVSVNDILMGEDFLNALRECYRLNTVRSYFRIFCGRCVLSICHCFLRCRWKSRKQICIIVSRQGMREYSEQWRNIYTEADFSYQNMEFIQGRGKKN